MGSWQEDERSKVFLCYFLFWPQRSTPALAFLLKALFIFAPDGGILGNPQRREPVYHFFLFSIARERTENPNS